MCRASRQKLEHAQPAFWDSGPSARRGSRRRSLSLPRDLERLALAVIAQKRKAELGAFAGLGWLDDLLAHAIDLAARGKLMPAVTHYDWRCLRGLSINGISEEFVRGLAAACEDYLLLAEHPTLQVRAGAASQTLARAEHGGPSCPITREILGGARECRHATLHSHCGGASVGGPLDDATLPCAARIFREFEWSGWTARVALITAVLSAFARNLHTATSKLLIVE